MSRTMPIADQLAALSKLSGLTFTADQLTILTPLLEAGNDTAIAATLSQWIPPAPRSLRVEEVFDVLFASGDYLTLKQAQLQGNAVAVLAFAALADAKALGPGTVNLTMATTGTMFDQLQTAGLLSVAGRAALVAKGSQPVVVQVSVVSEALNG